MFLCRAKGRRLRNWCDGDGVIIIIISEGFVEFYPLIANLFITYIVTTGKAKLKLGKDEPEYQANRDKGFATAIAGIIQSELNNGNLGKTNSF